MCQHFSYSVSTVLSRDRVWKLFADIANWTKFADVYDTIKWSGSPWTTGSALLGSIHYPQPLSFRYVVETCEPASRLTYVAQSTVAGFATHRSIRFDELHERTWIQVDSFIVGEPRFAVTSGGYGFLKLLTERWFEGFALFCDKQAVTGAQVLRFTVYPQVPSDGEKSDADETSELRGAIAQ
jgi:hypothetical protein